MARSTLKIGELTLILETGTDIQLQVIALGICPKCHTKTLNVKHLDRPMRWSQCSICNTVYCEEIGL